MPANDVGVVLFEIESAVLPAEVERGEQVGKPREKFVRLDDMLDAAGL